MSSLVDSANAQGTSLAANRKLLYASTMTAENDRFDKKSLRKVVGPTADWPSLVETCVAFAASSGGVIHIGIENEADLPPPDQIVSADLPALVARRVRELAVNVDCQVRTEVSSNGAEYLVVTVARSANIPSTSGGKYFLREGDRNRPITGDEFLRLARDRQMISWETLTSGHTRRDDVDPSLLNSFVDAIRASDRVKSSVKEKSADELLDHYDLAKGSLLTNLGVLCVGTRSARASLGTAPVLQYIKYDEHGTKLHKLVWDEYSLSPMQLVDAVWNEVPDFRENYELPDGLFRKLVPAYDESVIRELLVNALVHRPYTQRGDIFILSHPDRLEVVNPGPLPLGVTPATVLHTTARRNDTMGRIFHDLKLMDREGSGFDKMYEVLLAQGRSVPHVTEGADRVQVTIGRRIIKPEAIAIMSTVNATYQLTQRETICLGLLAQTEQMSARELASALMLTDVDQLQPWFGSLQDLNLVQASGRTKARRYYLAPELSHRLQLPVATTLGRIEPHRLEALILEDLGRYPDSAIGAVHGRIGPEINYSRVKRAVDALVATGRVTFSGDRRWRRYRLGN